MTHTLHLDLLNREQLTAHYQLIAARAQAGTATPAQVMTLGLLQARLRTLDGRA